MLKAQRILTAIAWAALVAGLVVLLRPDGLLLAKLALASLITSAISSLAALGLTFKTRTGWLLALLPLFGAVGLSGGSGWSPLTFPSRRSLRAVPPP